MMSARKQEPGQAELLLVPASLEAWAHHPHSLDEEAKAHRVPRLALDKQNEGRAGLRSRWPLFEAGNNPHMLKTNGPRFHAHFPMTPKSPGLPISGHRDRATQGPSWEVGSERMPPFPPGAGGRFGGAPPSGQRLCFAPSRSATLT